MTLNEITNDNDPIAALATGSGAGGIAVLRLSGRGCHSLLGQLITPKSSSPFRQAHLRLCELIDPSTGDIIDEPMVAHFYAPHSFTGEESAEISLHGGPYLVQRTLSLLFEHGFRAADPGEYTKRAFLNGKMDLTKAEGIKELVDATSHQQWLAARQLATGKLADKINELRELLKRAMAYLEARIDFPDEKETSEVEMYDVDSRVDKVNEALKKLASTYDNGRVAIRGLRVSLFGKPNAGKSTLMNAFLGHERAIVTDIPGTTRDYLEETCMIKGHLVRLVDTAGVRKTDETVEKIGVKRSVDLAKEADVVLFLLASDGTSDEKDEVERWIEDIKPKSYVKILTKADLITKDEEGWLSISCLSGQGMPELNDILVEKVKNYISPLKEETFVTSARHISAVIKAEQALEAFYSARSSGAYEEMLAFELQQANRYLSEIIGVLDSDEVLGEVFSSFCVGK